MRRLLLFITTLLFVFSLSACSETELKCTDGINDFIIEFNNKDITSWYDTIDGDMSTIDIENMQNAFIQEYGGDTPKKWLEKFVKVFEEKDETVTCEFK